MTRHTPGPSNPRRPAAGSGSPLFFGDVLKHLLVQEELGHQLLEALVLDLHFTVPALGVDLLGFVSPPPPIVGVLRDAKLSTDVPDRQAFG